MPPIEITIPKQIIFAIERYKLAAGVAYCLSITLLITPLIYTAFHTRRSHGFIPYQAIVYPIVNKLPAPAAVQPVSFTASAGSIWPMHGIVTTEFGVYHQPWQPTHTGIDISSAKPAGITSVTTFREGTVIQVVHDSGGFGNHVVVDHGSGLTSLYGHMASTAVTVGQHVTPGDVIGREGSTGASTGPHLHFETDLNGTPVSPRRYLPGNP
jgi:murein DD-endopeptidase MepM/ murein hydrolase activator NlpD